MLLQIDLLGLDANDLEWYQMFIRTLIVFVVAIAFIRIAGMRTFGTKTPFDVVVSITLGALLSRCITGHYPFFPTLSAALFLAAVHRLCAWLSYKNKFIRRFIGGKSIMLYEKKEMIKKSMAKYSITEQDMITALHEQNLDSYENVESMCLEPDGKISVVKK